jgi:hypothetical protein
MKKIVALLLFCVTGIVSAEIVVFSDKTQAYSNSGILASEITEYQKAVCGDISKCSKKFNSYEFLDFVFTDAKK